MQSMVRHLLWARRNIFLTDPKWDSSLLVPQLLDVCALQKLPAFGPSQNSSKHIDTWHIHFALQCGDFNNLFETLFNNVSLRVNDLSGE